MKVYIVVGLIISNDDIFPSISKYGIKSNIQSAKDELKLITKELREDIKKHNIKILSSEKYDTKISFELDNGTIEEYQIMERTVDFKD